jgi:hypothetical protein
MPLSLPHAAAAAAPPLLPLPLLLPPTPLPPLLLLLLAAAHISEVLEGEAISWRICEPSPFPRAPLPLLHCPSQHLTGLVRAEESSAQQAMTKLVVSRYAELPLDWTGCAVVSQVLRAMLCPMKRFQGVQAGIASEM